jgi:4-hydroxybenzoate polyprenyltransferase
VNNFIKVGIELARLHRPLPVLMLWLPCAWGLAITKGTFFDYVMFFIGSLSLRSFGCMVNDWWDQDIDALVPRSRQRPLARNPLSSYRVGIMALCSLIPGLLVFFYLNPWAKIMAMIGLIMAIIYPTTKRWFIAPQLFLGLTFNIGVWVAIAHTSANCWHNPEVLIQGVWLYLLGIGWTLSFDTVYAYSDYHHDQVLGLYSFSRVIERHPKGWLLILHGAMWIIWTIMGSHHKTMGIGSLFFIMIVDMVLVRWWQWEVNHPPSCIKAFYRHLWFGWAVWLQL